MKYFNCRLRYIFTINCSLVNCVLFLYDFFSKIVSTQHDTITTDLFHYTLSLDALYCSFFYLLRYNSCDSTPTFF